jgi:hypothetical protein
MTRSLSPFTPQILAIGLCALIAIAPAEAVRRRAFVTSITGTGDLGSWPEAGSATGLAAGNAICRARANAAGLPNANTYRAWLSTSTTDAYCHIRGQSGLKGACTGGTPLAAGPWYLANGITNFTGSLDELTNELEIYRPVMMDEFGDILPSGWDQRLYWTGSDPDGTVFASAPWHCSNWTVSDSTTGAAGDGYGTAYRWSTAGFGPSCNQPQRLLCLEPGESDVATLEWTTAATLVFLTKASGNGNLSSWPLAGGAVGLAAGDAICRAEAAAANLPAPESFLAWLSTTAVDARDRFDANRPFKRVDAYSIANSEADLLDGSIATTIHQHADGTYLWGVPDVATGTLSDGTASGADCLGWTSASNQVAITEGGPNWARLPDWTEKSTGNGCHGTCRLYCFSGRPVIFWDGFDATGDTSRWSASP